VTRSASGFFTVLGICGLCTRFSVTHAIACAYAHTLTRPQRHCKLTHTHCTPVTGEHVIANNERRQIAERLIEREYVVVHECERVDVGLLAVRACVTCGDQCTSHVHACTHHTNTPASTSGAIQMGVPTRVIMPFRLSCAASRRIVNVSRLRDHTIGRVRMHTITYTCSHTTTTHTCCMRETPKSIMRTPSTATRKFADLTAMRTTMYA
jgi:hypothetical protein